MYLYLILMIMILLVIVSLCDWFSRNARLIRRVPGPKAWPIIGNSMNIVGSPEKVFLKMRRVRKEFGPVSQIHAMNTRFILVSSPEDLEKLMSSPEYIAKADSYRFVAPWLGDGLLLSSGKKWQQRRKLLTKAFHFNILKKFMVTFKQETENFVKQVEKETFKEQSDLLALVGPAALRIINDTAMGISLGEDAFTKYFHSILIMGNCIVSRVCKVWLHTDFLFNLSSTARVQKRVLSILHGFTNKVIKNRRELLKEANLKEADTNDTYSNGKMALLDLLLENEKSENIDNEGIREEVDTFMFEGFDTTTIAMSFFLMAIANEPDIQLRLFSFEQTPDVNILQTFVSCKFYRDLMVLVHGNSLKMEDGTPQRNKIYEELHRVLGDTERLPNMEELNEMKYLECCIKESLRLYPSVPFIGRTLLKDTVLSGYTIPANSNCLFLIYDLHRRADIYPDPERFDPDRFLPENCVKRNVYAYIPFSAGLRNCIGQKFAMLEMKMVLSGLLRRFHVDPVTRPSELVFRTDLVLRTKDPIYVRFRLRN